MRQSWVALLTIIGVGYLALIPSLQAQAAAAMATLTGLANIVRYRVPARESWNPAVLGTSLSTGDSIQTGARSKAEITSQDGTILRMASSVTLVIMDPERRDLKLLLGKIWARVTGGGRGMVIRTPAAVVGIMGTEFVLEVLSDQSMQLTVLAGTVLLFPPSVSPVELDRGLQAPAIAPQSSSGSTKRLEMDESVSFRQGGGQSVEGPVQPIVVSAGQGAIARPDAPLHMPFQIDSAQVKLREESLVTALMPVSVNVSIRSQETPQVQPTIVQTTPVAAPPPPTDLTKAQLQNQRIDPKDLKGSPTTGTIRVQIKIEP